MKFKIECIGKFDPDTYVIARRLEGGDFALSSSPRLGGVSIQQFLTQPRKLKPDGSPDLDVFAFVLTDGRDAERFSVGQVVELET